MQKNHFLPLDGLRGIAVLLVVLHHSFRYKGASTVGRALDTAAAAGWVGVTLFFVLSGFLITGILLDTRSRQHYLRDFYARRTLRIFPLYFAFLSCYFLILPQIPYTAEHLPQPPAAKQIFYWSYTTNMREWLGNAPLFIDPLDPLWSLAVEEQVYLFWPFIILLFPRRRLAAVYVCIALFSFAWRVMTRLTAQSIELTYEWAPANFEAFALGALVAWCSREKAGALRRWVPRIALASGGFLFGLWAYLGTFNFWDSPLKILTAGTTGLNLFFASVIGITVTSGERSILNRALSLAWLRSIGKYSYAIYMLHTAIGALLKPFIFSPQTDFTYGQDLPGSLLFTIAVAFCSYLAACLTWYLWESQFLKLKKYFPLSGGVVRPLEVHSSPEI